jgi:hypothetical protein
MPAFLRPVLVAPLILGLVLMGFEAARAAHRL